MDFELLPVVLLLAGTVLTYSAVVNKQPLGVIKAALSGKPLDSVEPIMSGTAAPPGPGARDGATLPGTPGADGDARTDPPGFDPDRDDILPVLPGERAPGGAGVVSYRNPILTGRCV